MLLQQVMGFLKENILGWVLFLVCAPILGGPGAIG